MQKNSPDGGFLQSDYWRKFQENVGRRTFVLSTDDIFASIITHRLPIVGNYFYIPRGPVFNNQKLFDDLFDIAQENNISWIRIEPADDRFLKFLRLNLKNVKIKKSAVDMQPREILILDISKSGEDILAGMKQKTRYNIRLAEKRGVKIFESREKKYVDEFLRLVKITAERDRIVPHPESYYRKMFEVIPPEVLKLYLAEYDGKIVAANLVVFFGHTATYLHGASDNVHRDAMAPYLLQWRQMVDAKGAGCEKYDLGGFDQSKWPGITRFKIGFAPSTKPVKFSGSYDIILKPGKYHLYRAIQKLKRIF